MLHVNASRVAAQLSRAIADRDGGRARERRAREHGYRLGELPEIIQNIG